VGRNDLFAHGRCSPQRVCATLPIGFSSVWEEPLVKETDVIKGFRAQQQHGAGHKALRRPKSPEPYPAEPRARWGRKRPGNALGLATGIHKSRRDRGYPGILGTMEGLVKLPKLVRMRHGIRPDKQGLAIERNIWPA
jgi:hypothetical protein